MGVLLNVCLCGFQGSALLKHVWWDFAVFHAECVEQAVNGDPVE